MTKTRYTFAALLLVALLICVTAGAMVTTKRVDAAPPDASEHLTFQGIAQPADEQPPLVVGTPTPRIAQPADEQPPLVVGTPTTPNPNNPSTSTGGSSGGDNGGGNAAGGNNANAASNSNNPLTALTEPPNGSVFGINTIALIGLLAVVVLLIVVITVVVLRRRGGRD